VAFLEKIALMCLRYYTIF